MNLTRQIFLWCFFVFGSYRVFAGGNVLVKQFLNSKDWNFVENKGQVSASKIKFYGHQGGVYLYCKPGIISFVFTKVEGESDEKVSEATSQPSGPNSPLKRGPGGFGQEKNHPSKITTNRADLVFIGSNPSAQIISSDKQKYYENYYLANTPECGITNVHTYKTITYKNIYQHIDLILHSREEGMKYEFVVYPGGKVSDIKLKWYGLEGIKKLKDSKIEYAFALGKMTESAPYSYQVMDDNVGAGFTPAQSANIYDEKGDLKGRPYMDDTEDKIESHFVLKNNRIGFKIGKYDKSKALIIDPTLIWDTYLGNGNDIGYGIATDRFGNIFCAGSTGNSLGLATTGAFQTSFGGNQDAYLAKFGTNGKILWATYYGGKGLDYAIAVATDGSGNVYLTGSTESDSGIATSGTYQTSYAGPKVSNVTPSTVIGDAFLVKFDVSGKRLWGTYYGGESSDFGANITCDSFGNVYITGETESVSGIATKGAFQTSSKNLSPGYTDAFLAKFNSNGQIEWATYYSGDSNDGATGVATDYFGDVYITGETGSTGMATNGAYQTSPGGGNSNAFIAKFNSSGAIQWATYYGGEGEDVAGGIAFDGNKYLYVIGYTTSSSGISTHGAYQTLYTGNSIIESNTFLAKFDLNGEIRWATYYGGSGYNDGESVAINRQGSIYITGLTTSTSQIATSGAYQVSYQGSQDAFLSRFDSTGNLKWATYYGGNYMTGGYRVALDSSGSIYITGFTTKSSNIVVNGAPKTFGDSEEAFLAKFSIPDMDLNPNNFSLGFYPNPFYSSATLKYDLFANSNVNIVLYDAIGRQVAVIENKMKLAGQYSIDFNATKFPLAPGVYFLVFKSDEGDKTLKIVSY